MGWCRQRIVDLEAAIKSSDWKTVRDILKEHKFDSGKPRSRELIHELERAGQLVAEYFRHLEEIEAFVNGNSKARSDQHTGADIEQMQLHAEGAKEKAELFEKMLRDLSIKGTFLE